jgi:hypothetical protein
MLLTNCTARLNYCLTLISGFRSDVDEICGLLGYYAASCGNSLPTFRDLSYSDSWPVQMGPIRCPETSVNNYQTTPRNTPEDRRFHKLLLFLLLLLCLLLRFVTWCIFLPLLRRFCNLSYGCCAKRLAIKIAMQHHSMTVLVPSSRLCRSFKPVTCTVSETAKSNSCDVKRGSTDRLTCTP